MTFPPFAPTTLSWPEIAIFVVLMIGAVLITTGINMYNSRGANKHERDY